MRAVAVGTTFLLALLVLGGCDKKNDNPASPTTTANDVFASGNVKNTPVYFSFDTQDSVAATGAWDLELAVVPILADSTSNFYVSFPVIILNRTRNVEAKIVDSLAFDSVDPSTVTGLQTDPTDTTYVIGEQCLNYDDVNHKLNPYDNRTFVVKTGSGKLVKMRLLSYYNDQGASGYMKFEYAIM
jgi:hypothetical protein